MPLFFNLYLYILYIFQNDIETEIITSATHYCTMLKLLINTTYYTQIITTGSEVETHYVFFIF